MCLGKLLEVKAQLCVSDKNFMKSLSHKVMLAISFYFQNKSEPEQLDPKRHRHSDRDLQRNGGKHSGLQKMSSNSSCPGGLGGKK